MSATITIKSAIFAFTVYFCTWGCSMYRATSAPIPVPIAVIYNPDKEMIEAALKGRDPFTLRTGTRGVLTARTTRTVYDARNLPDYLHKLMEGIKVTP
ncbi:hypothetical protein K435DRAFT_777883 [Dendrothele bispora CBS 962.96]|uniref:Uncharacterized protein n=1 Tax=Dendrothele bispora (strain CBS 962.96) TaxID=1314807 RepID=A0A4S8M615_DENBC|nr:hypothetical protein K435DRAFT_777883 [Dendrothele bispora CBS 962.96]